MGGERSNNLARQIGTTHFAASGNTKGAIHRRPLRREIRGRYDRRVALLTKYDRDTAPSANVA